MMQQLLGQCVQQTCEVVLILETNADGHTVIRCASEGQGLGPPNSDSVAFYTDVCLLCVL